MKIIKAADYSGDNLLALGMTSWKQDDAARVNGQKRIFTAYIAKEDNWWIGWIQGVRGVNCQERTKKALLDSLKQELPEMLELNPDIFIKTPEKHFQPVAIEL